MALVQSGNVYGNAGQGYSTVYETRDVPTTGEMAQKSQAETAARAESRAYAMWAEQIRSQKEAAQKMGAGMSSLVNDYNKAFAEAKSEYENRYQAMLGIANSNEIMDASKAKYGEIMALAAKNSGQQAADINTAAGNTKAAQRANLQKLGMGNTTIGSSLDAGTERDRIANQNLLSDKFTQQRLGIMQNQQSAESTIAQNRQSARLGVMGSKQTSKDWAPDRSAISGLLNSTASGAGAYGVGALAQALGALSQ